MSPQEQSAVKQILNQLDSPVVVELGAYQGEDGPLFESFARDGKIRHIMVEPDPQNFAIIAHRSDRPLSENRVLIRAAVGARNEKRTFRGSWDSRDGARGSGSIIEPSGHLTNFPTIHFSDGFEVDCVTLDSIFDEYKLDHIDLLWVDIQGAEREMIEGGARAIRRSRFCFIEAEEVELYKGQALKIELQAMFSELGFHLVRDFGYNLLLENLSFGMADVD